MRQKRHSSPQKVIIDTDIGDDIDDAFALALALESPELKVLGVTTTFGNTEMRARLVDRYLQAVGRSDIPVFAGPMTKTDNAMTQAAYAKRAPEKRFGDGAEFILREAREHPGEITLIGIGPLFTVEAAIERDPAAFKKLKRVVIMGGSVYRGYGTDAQGKAEAPAAGVEHPERPRRPEGAAGIRCAGIHDAAGFDASAARCEGPRGNLCAWIASHRPVDASLSPMDGGTPNHSPTPTLFDPVAVTYTFRPDLCPAKPLHIDVDDKGLTTPGSGAPNAQVCLQSDEKGFLALLLKRVAAQ